MDRQTDRQIDMTKLVVTFQNIVNMPKEEPQFLNFLDE
jgi:hypothetical protein